MKDFFNSLDGYVDTRINYVDSCSQVKALEYRLGLQDVDVLNGSEKLEELRKRRHLKEKAAKEAKHKLSSKLHKLFTLANG